MKIRDFYEHYWQREGGSPADNVSALSARIPRLLAALSELGPGANILDAGCGNGEISLALSDQGYIVSGIDISSTAVEKARLTAKQARFETASVEETLTFETDEFDGIWCSEVLEHLFDVHGALSELNRVLRVGGLLVVTVPYHGRIKNVAIALAGFDRHYNPYLSHIRFYTPESLKTCLQRAGFTALTWQGLGRRWPLWMSLFLVARKTSHPEHPPEIIG